MMGPFNHVNESSEDGERRIIREERTLEQTCDDVLQDDILSEEEKHFIDYIKESRTVGENPNKREEYFNQKIKRHRDTLILKYHKQGHFGSAQVFNLLFYDGHLWRGMRRRIEEVLDECEVCKLSNKSRPKHNKMSYLLSENPMDFITVDLAGPMQGDERYQYMLVVTCVRTRFVILRALEGKTALEVCEKLLSICADFGLPKIVLSDQGKEFDGEVEEVFVKRLCLEWRNTPTYKQSSNGLAESMVKVSKTVLRRVKAATKEENWSLYVPMVHMFMNNRISVLTGYKPHFLMFGRNSNGFNKYMTITSGKLISGEWFGEKTRRDAGKINKRWSNIMRPIYASSYGEMKDKLESRNKAINEGYARAGQIGDFEVGDLVVVELMLSYTKRAGSLDPKFEGPYVIYRIDRGGKYALRDIDEPTIPIRQYNSVCIERLKLYRKKVKR